LPIKISKPFSISYDGYKPKATGKMIWKNEFINLLHGRVTFY